MFLKNTKYVQTCQTKKLFPGNLGNKEFYTMLKACTAYLIDFVHRLPGRCVSDKKGHSRYYSISYSKGLGTQEERKKDRVRYIYKSSSCLYICICEILRDLIRQPQSSHENGDFHDPPLPELFLIFN